MRQNRGMTDEKRLALLNEYLSSDKSKRRPQTSLNVVLRKKTVFQMAVF